MCILLFFYRLQILIDIDVDYVTYLFMSAIVVDLVVENVRCRNCVDLLVTSRIIYPFSADSYCGEGS